MKEQLITFETAKLAEKVGFKEEYPNNSYSQDGLFMPQTRAFQGLPAPTQSLLQKWLREVHSIDILIAKPESKYWNVYIWEETEMLFSLNEYAKSYEEALEKGLQEGLKLI